MIILEKFRNLAEYYLPLLPEAILTLVIGYLALEIIKLIIHRLMLGFKVKESLIDLLLPGINLVLWVILIIFVLKNLGLTGPALALTGTMAIVGLSLAQGGKDLLADIISGLMLSSDRDFKIGRKIKVGDTEGEVASLDIRKVRIRDNSGHIHIIPNSKVEKEEWIVEEEK
jgi:small conductance mechanosensitive channel